MGRPSLRKAHVAMAERLWLSLPWRVDGSPLFRRPVSDDLSSGGVLCDYCAPDDRWGRFGPRVCGSPAWTSSQSPKGFMGHCASVAAQTRCRPYEQAAVIVRRPDALTRHLPGGLLNPADQSTLFRRRQAPN
ncbi:hypothetical protein pneo_cds_479 [Pandoravirus neocaledonia]|uniref:Uncharacterized protein n=1 Tax=Pandoravirus neocaledonia TaxID=2107708 RepID=A0A2U7UCC2_9VIRU|nr:hypothetical protein pneo_cds_479 [Pandoravirus neocaledonia]AVK76086.1 hypothetical protein pneo_cds_479 [Pandoravirus neocaledonia]